MSRRDNNMDALRVVANIMVVVLHVSAVYVTQYLPTLNAYFTYSSFFNAFTRMSVPLFVMISGYFILANPKTADWQAFYKKTWQSIIIPTLIWSTIYVIFSVLLVRMNPAANPLINQDKYLNIFRNWALGQPFYHLWYLYMIIGMYAISPWLKRFLMKINQHQTLVLGWLLMGAGMLIALFIDLLWMFLFVEYLGYFILGYALKVQYQNQPKFGFHFLMIGIIASLMAFFGTQIVVTHHLLAYELYLYTNLSPFIVIGALTVYTAFVKLPSMKFDFSFLAKHSFNIYLIHAGVLHVINLANEYLFHQNLNPYWFIPLGSIVVYGLSLGLSITLNRINQNIKH